MGESLYNRDILRLAMATAGFARLERPDASASARSPICGSHITLDLALDALGRVRHIGGEVRACAMGQASSALFAERVIGLDRAAIALASDHFEAWLANQHQEPPWKELDIFDRARAHSARHGAILLPYRAALSAFETIDAKFHLGSAQHPQA